MKPILFSTLMVQAILAGRKSQTRRLLKTQPSGCFSHIQSVKEVPHFYFHSDGMNLNADLLIKPKYQVGDILWVRETWTQNGLDYYRYKADWPEGEGLFTNPSVPERFRGKWKPTIHMPKVAARIFLKVTKVRVERARDISGYDVLAEGIEYRLPHATSMTQAAIDYKHNENQMRQKFKLLWDSINGSETWNSWVFVYDFEVLSEQP